MTGRQRHVIDIGNVPRTDDEPAAVRVVADLLDDLGDLIHTLAVGCWPRTPLVAVDRTEVAVFVSPLVPNRDATLLKPLHVRVAAQEPEQLSDDGAQVQLLRRHGWEAIGEVEAHLVAKHAERAGTGSVALLLSVRQHMIEQVEVLPHW